MYLSCDAGAEAFPQVLPRTQNPGNQVNKGMRVEGKTLSEVTFILLYFILLDLLSEKVCWRTNCRIRSLFLKGRENVDCLGGREQTVDMLKWFPIVFYFLLREILQKGLRYCQKKQRADGSWEG